MTRVAFVERLVNAELLGRQDIDEMRKAAEEFRKLYNSQAFDEIVAMIHENQGLSAAKRAEKYIELCNKWSCRIGGSVRGEALGAIVKAEGLVRKIDKSLEQIERSDYGQMIKPVELPPKQGNPTTQSQL